LRKKNITLNGKKAEGTEKLNVSDSVKIFFSDETFEKFRGSAGNASAIKEKMQLNALKKFGKLEIIYEDSNILLVNKPAGVLSQKSQKNDLSLNDWLIEYMLDKGDITAKEMETYKPSICNRLDRNTSGLVICAKSLLGARTMNGMLKDRTLDKYYRTIVSGRIEDKSTLKGYLYKDEKSNKVTIKKDDPHDERYSYIETEYVPVAYDKEKDLTMLEVKLITGKTHQIRAHLSSIAHPIIGDVKYGGKVLAGQKFQLLHSYRLVFPSKMPEGFEAVSGREFIAKMPKTYSDIIHCH
nr:RluA family pseudouridine synthase [Butyrivibrio sp.]